MSTSNVIKEEKTVGEKILYTAKVHIIGGRDGSAKSNDGRLDITLSNPGSKGTGTNPEQLFAAGWSACFMGAMHYSAAKQQVTLPADTTVDAAIGLASGGDGFSILAHLMVNLPGADPEQAKAIVAAAHETCPYSKATRGNINITIDVAV
jgi:Ohr subfamily peroxiredoxin